MMPISLPSSTRARWAVGGGMMVAVEYHVGQELAKPCTPRAIEQRAELLGEASSCAALSSNSWEYRQCSSD
jgi:hypothetical protein